MKKAGVFTLLVVLALSAATIWKSVSSQKPKSVPVSSATPQAPPSLKLGGVALGMTPGEIEFRLGKNRRVITHDVRVSESLWSYQSDTGQLELYLANDRLTSISAHGSGRLELNGSNLPSCGSTRQDIERALGAPSQVFLLDELRYRWPAVDLSYRLENGRVKSVYLGPSLPTNNEVEPLPDKHV